VFQNKQICRENAENYSLTKIKANMTFCYLGRLVIFVSIQKNITKF